jgi:cation-transporting P-type ATPase F
MADSKEAAVSSSDWHAKTEVEVLGLLASDLAEGLTGPEIPKRQAIHGPNLVTAKSGTPPWLRFLLQFHQPLVYILLAAGAITAFLGEYVDSAVIFGVVLINAIVGFIQEAKAERAIEALSSMVVTAATVRRGGRKLRVPSAELVPGDIVLLQSGDLVPADLRLVTVNSLQVDESALTGESMPVQKALSALAPETSLADRRNLAFAGTHVTSGQAEGIVFAIGNATETGRIAGMLAGTVELSTPLTRKITAFSQLLLWLILGLAALGFAVGVMRGEKVVDMFMASVALAVGAIPEGLPAAVTIVLAIGVNRMARRRAIIRKLPAVETLGGTTVICSDKTGTLTENQMTVQRIFAGGRIYTLTGTGYDPVGDLLDGDAVVNPEQHPALRECLRAGVLCNDSELTLADGRPHMQGDPTEAALLVAGAKGGLIHAATVGTAPRLDMIPFESEHMFRATLHGGGRARTIYKVGAVERLLERCSDQLAGDGSLAPLEAAEIHRKVEAFAADGLRVLALARRHVADDHDELSHEHVKEGLTFLGLQGMIDPPRKEAVAAVASCRQAGIRVKMITGDHAITARAVALQIGLADEGADGIRVVTGRELEGVSDEDLPDLAMATEVFARVAPEQKLRLVRALQSRGQIVAMTGDGVNDAPALKQSDIGIAMGITGTDVAKGAADMILTDDHFATIAAAVEEGRGVFDNLRKFIIWTLPTSFGGGCIVLLAMLLGFTLPVLPVQLLWVNMTTALLLGLMLVFEPKEPGLMNRPPRDPAKALLTFPLFMRTGLVTLIMIAGAYWLFYYEQTVAGETLAEARTAVVNVIVAVETAYLFCCRSLNQSVFRIGFWTNRFAFLGAAAMIAAQLLYTYAPVMNRLFHSTPLSIESWLHISAVALAAFVAVEFEKWVRFGGKRGEGRELE